MPRSLAVSLSRIAAAAVLASAGSAHAVVIWDESVDGDLEGNQAAVSVIGTLGLGLNTVSGQLYRPSNIGAQGDSFALTLPAGLLLQSLSLVITNSTATDTMAATLYRAPVNGQTYSGLQQIHPIINNGTYNFTVPAALLSPLAQDYHLGLSAQFASGASNSLASMDWEWQATVVAAVPEPAGVTLALAGLGVLGAMARRRSARG